MDYIKCFKVNNEGSYKKYCAEWQIPVDNAHTMYCTVGWGTSPGCGAFSICSTGNLLLVKILYLNTLLVELNSVISQVQLEMRIIQFHFTKF